MQKTIQFLKGWFEGALLVVIRAVTIVVDDVIVLHPHCWPHSDGDEMYEDGCAAKWNVDSPRAEFSKKGERHDEEDEDDHPEEDDKEQAAAAHAALARKFYLQNKFYNDDKDT